MEENAIQVQMRQRWVEESLAICPCDIRQLISDCCIFWGILWFCGFDDYLCVPHSDYYGLLGTLIIMDAFPPNAGFRVQLQHGDARPHLVLHLTLQKPQPGVL